MHGLIQCLSDSSSSVTTDLIFSVEYRIIVPARTKEVRMMVGDLAWVPTNDTGLVWPFIESEVGIYAVTQERHCLQ